MIANVRPEAYAHLTALIADVYNRFDETQISVSYIYFYSGTPTHQHTYYIHISTISSYQLMLQV